MTRSDAQAGPGLRSRVAAYLGHRLFPFAVMVLAFVATMHVVTVGTAADDWLHQLYAAPKAQLNGLTPRPWDLFVFATGDPQDNWALMDSGVFPWWTDPQAKLAFFRPVAVFFHRLDGWLWADYPAMMHGHSLAWFLLGLWIVSSTFRLWLSQAKSHAPLVVAGLAFWLFALDDARGPTLGWIANRNALLSLTLGASTLLLHARATQRDAHPWDKNLAYGLWGVTLLCGEASLGFLPYLIGYTIWIDKREPRDRYIRLVPYIILAGSYLLLRHSLGYGAFSSDFYIDPILEPLAYLKHALERIPILMASCLVGVWSDIPAGLGVAHPTSTFYWAIGCTLVTLPVVVLGWPFWRQCSACKTFGLGFIGNIVLCATTFPADRILGITHLGSSVLLATLVWQGTRSLRRWSAAHLGVWTLLVIHAVASPAWLPARVLSMQYAVRPIQRVHASLPAQDDLLDHTLVLLNPPSDPQASYFMIYRLAHGLARPERLRWLSAGPTALSITRLDERTLRLVQDQGFLPRMSERMLHSSERPFMVGDEINLTGLRITIEALTEDHRPAQVRFTFDRPLEDPHFLWARWDGLRFVPYRPPRVGAPDKLPAHDVLDAFAPLPDTLTHSPNAVQSLEQWRRAATASQTRLP